MSCSVHDGIELEDRGIPCVPVHTAVFMNSAAAHSLAFGRPGFPSVSIRHPIAGVDPEGCRERAEEAIGEIVGTLIGGGHDPA